MKPIINPLYIYLISIISTLKIVLEFIMFFAGIAILVVGMLYFLGEMANKRIGKRILKTATITFIISLLICIFVPDENTCYKMMATSIVTPDNIETVKDETIKTIEEIANILQNKNSIAETESTE